MNGGGVARTQERANPLPFVIAVVVVVITRQCLPNTSSSAVAEKPRCRVGQFWLGGG